MFLFRLEHQKPHFAYGALDEFLFALGRIGRNVVWEICN